MTQGPNIRIFYVVFPCFVFFRFVFLPWGFFPAFCPRRRTEYHSILKYNAILCINIGINTTYILGYLAYIRSTSVCSRTRGKSQCLAYKYGARLWGMPHPDIYICGKSPCGARSTTDASRCALCVADGLVLSRVHCMRSALYMSHCALCQREPKQLVESLRPIIPMV